jgi:hypothetical protein
MYPLTCHLPFGFLRGQLQGGRLVRTPCTMDLPLDPGNIFHQVPVSQPAYPHVTTRLPLDPGNIFTKSPSHISPTLGSLQGLATAPTRCRDTLHNSPTLVSQLTYPCVSLRGFLQG